MTESQTKILPVPVVDPASLGDVLRAMLAEVTNQTSDYNSRGAALDAATGDRGKFVHELRENSDDAEVVKVRKYLADIDAKREAVITKIDAYISENLLGGENLSPEHVAAETESLKALKANIDFGRKYFLGHPTVSGTPGAADLLPMLRGARKGVSKGTGTGAAKPRVTGVYVDGALMSHAVVKEGVTSQKSTFTDAVKFLSDKYGVKIATSDLHGEYFAAAGVTADNWQDGPDKCEFSFHVTDPDGASHNHSMLVTK